MNRWKAVLVVLVVGVGNLALQTPAHAATTCTWAGSLTNPTGTFWINPGLTNTPSTQDLKFVAKGVLAGGGRCHGSMTFIGKLDKGATCPESTFEGRVYGLRGVYSWLGRGSLDVPSQLFDREGRWVGQENAEIVTPSNFARALDCATPRGFQGGWPDMFSSVVVLF